MYKIIVTRSFYNHFFWNLCSSSNRKLAESKMYTSKDMCFKTVKPLALKLKAKIVFIDLEKDYEE